MSIFSYKNIIFSILAIIFFINIPLAYAENFSVSPLVIDEKVHQRDIVKKQLTLTNNTNRSLRLYASVNNVDEMSGATEFLDSTEASLNESLANWIEISRGVIILDPAETKSLPFLIHVNLNASPRIYHAEISLFEGENRAAAEENTENKASISINVEVVDDRTEHLELRSFIPDKTFFTDSTATFSYALSNTGDKEVTPKGEIRIYNRKGEEVGTIDANTEGTLFEPDSADQLAAAWSSDGGFGKYKALLDITYGDTNRAAVYDTVYFWIMPWKKILMLFVGLALLLVTFTLIAYSRYMPRFVQSARASSSGAGYSNDQAEEEYSSLNNVHIKQHSPTVTPEKNDTRTHYPEGAHVVHLEKTKQETISPHHIITLDSYDKNKQ